MDIQPRAGILLIRKHTRTALKHDIAVEEADEDKRLITGTVVSDDQEFPEGTTVIFGRYALYKLAVQGEDYYLLDVADVLGTCEYKE